MPILRGHEGADTEWVKFPPSPGTQLGVCVSDHQKLEREARICRLLKHPNIGELWGTRARGVWVEPGPAPLPELVGVLGWEGNCSLLWGWRQQ